MKPPELFLSNDENWTRRRFVRRGVAGAAAWTLGARVAWADPPSPPRTQAIEGPEPYFTSPALFRDVSRGTPLPHSLSESKKKDVGLTRETWKLEVIPDPEFPAVLGSPLSQKAGSALDFPALMALAAKRSVRFAKVMTCLNIGCPLGMGIWEGVPLRDVLWLTQPRDNLRRVFYYGYHNDDPRQLFQSSLPISRALEDPFDLPPVILCYKLNGEWLDSERGGPVRMVVPEAYGFKSIKWLTHVLLSNRYQANDTYAEGNNDVDTWLKTFAATINFPRTLKARERAVVTGYAQVGLGGLSKVQTWIQAEAKNDAPGNRFFADAPWVDAQILPPPVHWGELPGARIPPDTLGFNSAGEPITWPMRLTKVFWSATLPELAPGTYTFRSRAIDEKGIAQPLPRPFQKSGHSSIEAMDLNVEG